MGVDKKADILVKEGVKEGVKVKNGKIKDLEKYMHTFST